MRSARTHEEPLPYEATAEQIAREQMIRLSREYEDASSLAVGLEVELKDIIHDAMEFGMQLADSGMGDIPPAELLVAYAAGEEAGARESRKGEA